jgi:hypothetical protein
MTAGLPGTGIGGIFYLLLAIAMPIRELFRAAQGKTNLKRWGLICLQLLFVAGIFVTMWGEVWALNSIFLWLCQSYGINCPLISNNSHAFEQTKSIAIASGMASFISLAFVLISTHILYLWIKYAGQVKLRFRPTPFPAP